MTNPKKNVEKLLQSARDAVMNAVPDVAEAKKLLYEYYNNHSDAWQTGKKVQIIQSAIVALDKVIVAMESAFDTEPDLSDL